MFINNEQTPTLIPAALDLGSAKLDGHLSGSPGLVKGGIGQRGAGLEFLQMSEESRHRLARYMDRYRRLAENYREPAAGKWDEEILNETGRWK